jgi:hypothetical protein
MTLEDRKFISEQVAKVDARFSKLDEAIERLAISTQQEFTRIGERFDSLGGRFDALAAKVTADQEFQIRTLESKMDRVYQHLGLTEKS